MTAPVNSGRIISGFFSAAAIVTVCFICMATSCEREELKNVPDDERTVEAFIREVVIPDEILAGEPASFEITYVKPNPCYDFKDIFIEHSGSDLYLKVLLFEPDPDEICIMVVKEEQESFEHTFEKAGTYTMDFKEESSGIAPVELRVTDP